MSNRPCIQRCLVLLLSWGWLWCYGQTSFRLIQHTQPSRKHETANQVADQTFSFAFARFCWTVISGCWRSDPRPRVQESLTPPGVVGYHLFLVLCVFFCWRVISGCGHSGFRFRDSGTSDTLSFGYSKHISRVLLDITLSLSFSLFCWTVISGPGSDSHFTEMNSFISSLHYLMHGFGGTTVVYFRG